MTQDSVVFALGVVILDGMRVGYGQKGYDMSSDSKDLSGMGEKTAVMYRFFQGAFGILAYMLITVAPGEIVQNFNETTGALISTDVTQEVAAPVLYGVGLASA